MGAGMGSMNDQPKMGTTRTTVALALVFFSGLAALIYQVLWMRELGLLFGNTAHAAGITLAAFFAGLAVGSWVLGRRVTASVNPMKTYARLELALAFTALLYFVVPSLFQLVYPPLYRGLDAGGVLTGVKLILALLLVFPPAFCMGGTVPVIGEALIQVRARFATTAALVYGLNTLGAATGAVLAGFYLPLWLGFRGTCLLALAVSAGVAAVAWALASREPPGPRPAFSEAERGHDEEVPLTRQQRRQYGREGKEGTARPARPGATRESSPGVRWSLRALCFLSGFGVLALEVLWTRMFAQVLENSVYTFAAILVVVLLALAAGAVLSAALSRSKAPPMLVLALLIGLGAVAVMATPALFLKTTNGMQLVFSGEDWSSYLFLIFRKVTMTIGPSAVILGTVFPYLMKIEEARVEFPGLSLGRLVTANTIGAILGALGGGFFFLDLLGMWGTMHLIAFLYLAAALAMPLGWEARGLAVRFVGVGILLLHLLVFKPRELPVVSIDPQAERERVLEVWEGSDATVAVTKGRFGLAIKINSHYSLGSTGSYPQERFQTDLPLMVYPDTESIFYLGVGTGITAGGALDPRHAAVKRVVACELEADVITAAQKYIARKEGFDPTGGLFRDPRAEVLIEDGRHHLMATDERYDMINADLFVPFRAGAGSLYTREHYENARERLAPNGVFVQWLPLYQLTEKEFFIIARTMLEVFEQVSLWRHNFQPGDEILALMGHRADQPLPASDLNRRADKLQAVVGKTHRDLQRLKLPLDSQTITLFYGGNLTAARSLFASAPVNTDDHPVIEYLAPRSYRAGGADEIPWLVGAPLADLIEQVQEMCPPADDPFLARRSPANRRLPLAGSAFHRARIAEVRSDGEATKKAWETFLREWLNKAPDAPDEE